MRALTVRPGTSGSALVGDLPEPAVVQAVAVGVCGTDLEIASGEYGQAPPGQERLVLGHENLGRVISAPAGSGLTAGQLVVGIVRRPDPVPCPNCAVGEWDMCRNGQYTERGIKGRNGYCSERYRIEPDFTVPVDAALGLLGVLLEPTTVVAKAWEHAEAVGRRARWEPRTALITGAGPVGLLAALLGRQRGLDVHVLDQVTDGPKPALVRDLGATYHSGSVLDTKLAPDVVIEATGVAQVVFDAMSVLPPDGVLCLTGVSSSGHRISVDAGMLNRDLVLEHNVVVGSVNANRRHYEQGATALASADPAWLARIITRRVPLESATDALHRQPDDIKAVIEITPI